MKWTLLIILLAAPGVGRASELIPLFPGYTTKIHCEGRLLVSAVGNPGAVALQALPEALGCGVYLNPKARHGKSDLWLETSTGTVLRILEIESRDPVGSELEYRVKGDSQ